MKSIHIQVYGRVQGVGFRYFTYTKAVELGIVGWVRNLGDGSVEIRANGDERILEQFLAIVKVGPSYGEVTHIVAEVEAVIKMYHRFTMG